MRRYFFLFASVGTMRGQRVIRIFVVRFCGCSCCEILFISPPSFVRIFSNFDTYKKTVSRPGILNKPEGPNFYQQKMKLRDGMGWNLWGTNFASMERARFENKYIFFTTAWKNLPRNGCMEINNQPNWACRKLCFSFFPSFSNSSQNYNFVFLLKWR